jgi:hypothetical protein
VAVVSQLAMVEVSLEDDQVGFREVEEEVGSFGVEVPVGESGAPEGVLLVDLESDPLREYRERFLIRCGWLTQMPCFSYSWIMKNAFSFCIAKASARTRTFHLNASFLSDLSS